MKVQVEGRSVMSSMPAIDPFHVKDGVYTDRLERAPTCVVAGGMTHPAPPWIGLDGATP